MESEPLVIRAALVDIKMVDDRSSGYTPWVSGTKCSGLVVRIVNGDGQRDLNDKDGGIHRSCHSEPCDSSVSACCFATSNHVADRTPTVNLVGILNGQLRKDTGLLAI